MVNDTDGLGVSAPLKHTKPSYEHKRWRTPLLYFALSVLLPLVAIISASKEHPCHYSQSSGAGLSVLEQPSTEELPQTEMKGIKKISSWIRLATRREEKIPASPPPSWFTCMKTVVLDVKQFMNILGQTSVLPPIFFIFAFSNLLLSIFLLVRAATAMCPKEKESVTSPINHSLTKVKKEEELELGRTEEQDQNQSLSPTPERSNIVSPEATTKVSSPFREDASSPIDENVSPRSIVAPPPTQKADNECAAVNNSKKIQMEQADGPRKKQKPNVDGLELPLLKKSQEVDDTLKKHELAEGAKSSRKKRRLASNKV
eukprot:CAMPEP_0178919782 /NCGR_PEP_ID=MMETSP0786-20121207/14633_1 /TAXON_ID=186022 /ORGANISM="Thalassionema frauenfeldii, Strain CCMP 1798" /LENGTH=314 /DNA_ID=CAMNT_0020593761 /DNA_START=28 /DNA_END=972 /DNA_ORIENTATION=+